MIESEPAVESEPAELLDELDELGSEGDELGSEGDAGDELDLNGCNDWTFEP